ncbi:MAG: hypothetical protein RR548_05000, partial [Carnobacterium sp.]|uniref:hypothetical protein n=1 Tax=Carnobacterium sp. TaxID=48221 RepID=UPI002FCC0F11
MYQVSNDFSTSIKNNARFIKSYFTLDGVSYDIRTLTIDDFIYADGNFIGTFIAKNGTIKLNHIDSLNLEDKEIKVFIGVKTINGFEYVPMGTYKIYESIENDEYKIIDYRYKFNIPFDSSKMFYPTTPLKLLQEACKQAGVLLSTSNFPNKDLDIPNEVFFGYDAKCADVITAVAQASCSIAKIDRDDRLVLKWFATASFAIDLDHQTKKPNTNDVYGPINTVVLSNEPQTDSIYYPKELPLNVKEVKIVNNPLLGVDRNVSIVPFYNRINGFSYVPYNTASQGYFHLDACDIVKLQLVDKTYIDAMIMNQTIVFKGGISSSFDSPALTKAQMDFAMADNTDKKIYETELYVDRVAGEIKSEVKSVSSQVYRFETGNWNIFKNCNKELSTGSVSDMELDITKSYIRSKDICISCGIDVSDANYNVGAAGAYFDVSYMDNTIQRIETKWVPGQPTIDYLIDSCTSITKRIFTHYKVQDKEIKSVSN